MLRQATFERGADESRIASVAALVSEPLPVDGFVSFLERIREDWSHFLGADPESWTYIT